ncbi:MAG: monovalent cation/H+ antiporter complex subunit F [Candidatus Nanopelagicales bacterium]|jgi:multicomponent Na+:H+ antiporter subunit F|nr:monovalent cation/H+ antiporter complex subunit F [Candidatus Nanopelagicales bacterium]
MITAIALAAGTVLAVSALLALVRVVRGPTIINRIVALDVMVSILISALGVEAAYNRHTTTVPIIVALALVGFVGSVSVARFVARDEDGTGDEAGAPTTLGVDT